jgi:NAD(P)H-flavin reductase
MGPYGYNFAFSKQDLNGHFVLIAGGTGLFPFLDLLDYLLRRTLYILT